MVVGGGGYTHIKEDNKCEGMINVEGMGQSLAPGLADRQDRGTIPYYCKPRLHTKYLHVLIYTVQYRPLLPNGWRIVQILRQRQREPTYTVPTTPRAACLSTFINAQLYCNCGNDKNKQLTLLSQPKLALTAKNSLFAL